MSAGAQSPPYGTWIDATTWQDSWELRVYLGTDTETCRPRWLTKTVHGTQRLARRQLEDLVEEASHTRIHAGTLAQYID